MQFTREHSREETSKAECHIEDRRSFYRILKSWWCPYLFNVTCPDCNSTVRAEKRSWLCQKKINIVITGERNRKGLFFNLWKTALFINRKWHITGWFWKNLQTMFFSFRKTNVWRWLHLILYWSTIFVQNNTMSVSQARLYWRIYISASYITEQDECSL